jgi:indolepyruvate ferredoxin oxidoreductase beta subunit
MKNAGRTEYPSLDAIKGAVEKLGGEVVTIDATSLAQQAENVLTMNVVMLGALAGTGKLPISVETLKEVVKENVPPKTIEANFRAFELGFKAVQKS